MPARLCRHKPCACEPPAGEVYCDPACAQAVVEAPRPSAVGEPVQCPCGHPACRPGNAERFSEGGVPVV